MSVLTYGRCDRSGCEAEASVVVPTDERVLFMCPGDADWFHQMEAWQVVVDWFALCHRQGADDLG